MKVIHSILSSSDVGKIEESYVQSYIQTQSIGIACAENGGQCWTAEGEGNAGLSINPRAPAYAMWRHTAWESKRQA